MRIRPELCVGGLAIQDDALLLVRRGRPPGAGLWSVPGGRVEGGETIAEALIREMEEETGLAVLVGPLVDWVERIGPGYHFVILDFEVTVVSDQPPVAGDDAAEVAWIPLDQVTDLPLVEGLAEFLAANDLIPTIV